MTANFHVVVGLGISGLSVAKFLHAEHIPFAIMDTRKEPPLLAEFKQLFPEVEIVLGGLDESLLKRAAAVVISPGIALSTPAIAACVAADIPVVGDIELFAHAVKAPVIAITGTNAKSTVTTLVALMAEAADLNVAVGGNLGTPALDLLLNQPKAQVFVLEISSFQLETTFSLQPKVATVLNITPDHMDRYQTLADYQRAKLRVYQGAKIAVCNKDDALTECPLASVDKIYFTLNAPANRDFGLRDEKGITYLAHGETLLMPVDELPVIGKHYQANALAALALGHGFGLPMPAMLQVLKTFTGLPHRCQLVRTLNEVRWYNDSKGTNVGATVAAIEGIGSQIAGKLVLIAGGVGKNADFKTLAPAVCKYSRHAVLFGEAAKEIGKVLAPALSISYADSLAEAVKLAKDHALPQDCVLLSPACASFDMFKNYEHRGIVFMELVQQL